MGGGVGFETCRSFSIFFFIKKKRWLLRAGRVYVRERGARLSLVCWFGMYAFVFFSFRRGSLQCPTETPRIEVWQQRSLPRSVLNGRDAGHVSDAIRFAISRVVCSCAGKIAGRCWVQNRGIRDCFSKCCGRVCQFPQTFFL